MVMHDSFKVSFHKLHIYSSYKNHGNIILSSGGLEIFPQHKKMLCTDHYK